MWAASIGDPRNAGSRGHVDTIQLLLDKGADIDVQGGAHHTVLQAASFLGYTEVVKLLLRRGAGIDIEGFHGRGGNALVAALCMGHKDIAHLILTQLEGLSK